MSDPLEQVEAFIAQAKDERDTLRHRLAVSAAELHQLQRRLARAEATAQEVSELNTQLKQLLEAAEARTARSERATRDHIART